jgi:hypothetical protein
MTVRVGASIFAYRMGFPASPAGVIRAASLAAILALCAAGAAAETIPGPPIGVTASDRAGASCDLRDGAGSNALAFAAGVAIVAIAARRRVGDADA